MATKDKDEKFPQQDADLGGDYARDTHRGAYGDDYAREGNSEGSGARGDAYGSTGSPKDEGLGKAGE
jgi:hypothetical protein